jgi:hypothetical protein
MSSSSPANIIDAVVKTRRKEIITDRRTVPILFPFMAMPLEKLLGF